MKKIFLFLSIIVLIIALAGCGLLFRREPDPDPTPTLVPTTAPIEEAVEEPTEEPMEEPAAEGIDEPEDTEEPGEAEAMMISEVDIAASPYTALANETFATVAAATAECPVREFPIPDPDTDTKRGLDFTPFAEAMAGFTPEMAASLDASLINATLPEIQALMADGTLTSEQLVLYYLDRIQRYDANKLNSILELNPAALADAQALDSARPADASGLYGVPIVVKDNIAVAAPLHTASGTYAFKDWQASRDAFLVQQLREAGAVILGKANQSEWANYTDPCMPNGYSALGGQVRHAWGLFDPAGSSTGSAVSVSANVVPVSIGSETSGSLTAPARLSGVVGMRPSQGLVSGDFIIPLEANLDTAGPMGHSVTDVAILLNAIAGVDANDPNTERAAALAGTDFTQFLTPEAAQDLKVAVVQFDVSAAGALLAAGQITVEEVEALTPEEWQQLSDLLAPSNGAATQPIIDTLQSLGIEVVVLKESELPPLMQQGEVGILNYGFQNAVNAFLAGLGDEAPVASLAEAAALVNEDPANRAPYGQRYVEWSAATETTAEVFEQAIADGRQYHTDWFQWFKDAHDVDVILMGSLYQSAGLANIPALTIPTGLEATGQPSGVVISGPYLSDSEVLTIGYALEQALGVDQQPDLEATMALIAPVTGEAPAAEAALVQPPLIGMQTPRLRELDFSPFAEDLANFSADQAAAVDALVSGGTILDVQAAMDAGEVTSEALTLYFLSRIQQYDDALRNYTEINPNALEEARSADALRAEGTVLGPMHGIPVNLKDNLETTAPLHTTGGAEILLDYVPDADAPLVTQLREGGAVILGKANLSELAGGVALYPAGYTAVAGQTINPHGADFTTLGSSSGSGASTAAALTMVSVGSETAGSLIAPAALNGVVGMYPTDDLVSDEGGIPLLAATDTAGPIARSVTDAAILLSIIDTADVDYAATLDANALNGVTVGYLAADLAPGGGLTLNGFEDTSDQAEKLELIATVLESSGAEVVPAELTLVEGLVPSVGLVALYFGPTLAANGITDLSELDEETLNAMYSQIPVKIIIASDYLSTILNFALEYDMVSYLAEIGAPVSTLAELAAYNEEMPDRRIPNGQFQILSALPAVAAAPDREVYERVIAEGEQLAADVLDAAFAASGSEILVSMVNEHSAVYAMAGYPAITVPLGLRANGAPTGVTFIGKPGQDAQLLAYAYAFEQASMLRQTPDVDATVQQIQ